MLTETIDGILCVFSSDAEREKFMRSRAADVARPGEVVRVPLVMMDGLDDVQKSIRDAAASPVLADAEYRAAYAAARAQIIADTIKPERLADARQAADASWLRSVADLNAWRTDGGR